MTMADVKALAAKHDCTVIIHPAALRGKVMIMDPAKLAGSLPPDIGHGRKIVVVHPADFPRAP